MTTNRENLGPAERIIQTLTTYVDHSYHNRPGIVTKDPTSPTGVKWVPASHRVEKKDNEDRTVVYEMRKVPGKKGKMRTQRVAVGYLRNDGQIGDPADGRRIVGRYQKPGLFSEVVAYLYKSVAEVYKLDNEFCARWASYTFTQDSRDLKAILAAFMLVQSRKGDPVRDNGTVAFYDDDYRDVGEAMMVIYRKSPTDMQPKALLRIHDILSLPEVAKINHELGFGQSDRKPFYGRWTKAVTKWLRYREENPSLLNGLVKAGYRTTVMELARRCGYKPTSESFFETLRWKQKQATDGRRTIAIDKVLQTTETWETFTERQVCEAIVSQKPNWKRIVGQVPKSVGITRAVMSAAIEAGCLSDKDILIACPTIEDLGLATIFKDRIVEAGKRASTDMRAANIAQRVRSKDLQETLNKAADESLQKTVEVATRNMRVYFMIDISSSMTDAIDRAKDLLAKFLQGFPVERTHVAVFNTSGREVKIQHASAAGVTQAFKGIDAGGGTDYGAGIRALQKYKPTDDSDSIFFFVGDEEAPLFTPAVQASGLNPVAFGFLKVRNSPGYRAVQDTAAQLNIPCFMIDQNMFGDVYAIPRTITNLIASTPVGKVNDRITPKKRESIVDVILKTEILKTPAWAS